MEENIVGKESQYRVKVVITEGGSVTVFRCEAEEEFVIMSRYFEEEKERMDYAEDLCEIFYMLDLSHALVDEKTNTFELFSDES